MSNGSHIFTVILVAELSIVVQVDPVKCKIEVVSRKIVNQLYNFYYYNFISIGWAVFYHK